MKSTKNNQSFDSGWLYVGGNGPGNHSTIQNAIDAATTGDFIFVFNATYYENIIIDKSIQIHGEKKDSTIINGQNKGDVVKIIQENVFLNNFTLCNSGPTINDAGIEIRSNSNIIQNTSILDVSYGIWLINSTNNILSNNSITAQWDGIWLFRSAKNIITHNSLYGCGVVLDGQNMTEFIQDISPANSANDKPIYYYKHTKGITIPDDAGQVILVNCSNSEISNLTITNVTDCIEIMFSDHNTIKNNVLTHSTDYGLRMFHSQYNKIYDNTFRDNPAGIGFIGLLDLGGEDLDFKNATMGGTCRYNTISHNNFLNNWYGLRIYRSDNNFISNNMFKTNKKSAFFYDCKNQWNKNYWNRPRYVPKLILGLIPIDTIQIPWINIDWHPAKQPYDIS